MIVFKIGVDATSTNNVIPAGTYTESPSLGSTSPPHVACEDHLSIYKNGATVTSTEFPSVVTVNEFPEGGADAR